MKPYFRSSAFALLLTMMGAFAIGAFTPGCAATSTRDSTGQYIDDTAITAKVKSALLADMAVKSHKITVETDKGVVKLSGVVDNAHQKSAASNDASGVDGVKDVENNIVVR